MQTISKKSHEHSREWHSLIQAITPKISVAVVNGKVTLSGTVRSFSEKRAIEDSIAGVSGIRCIFNEIMVSVASGPDIDNRIQEEIIAILQGKKQQSAPATELPYWKYFE